MIHIYVNIPALQDYMEFPQFSSINRFYLGCCTISDKNCPFGSQESSNVSTSTDKVSSKIWKTFVRFAIINCFITTILRKPCSKMKRLKSSAGHVIPSNAANDVQLLIKEFCGLLQVGNIDHIRLSTVKAATTRSMSSKNETNYSSYCLRRLLFS